MDAAHDISKEVWERHKVRHERGIDQGVSVPRRDVVRRKSRPGTLDGTEWFGTLDGTETALVREMVPCTDCMSVVH